MYLGHRWPDSCIVFLPWGSRTRWLRAQRSPKAVRETISQITGLQPDWEKVFPVLREGFPSFPPPFQVPEDEILSKGQQQPETSSDKTPKPTAYIAWGLIVPFSSVNVIFCIHDFGWGRAEIHPVTEAPDCWQPLGLKAGSVNRKLQ